MAAEITLRSLFAGVKKIISGTIIAQILNVISLIVFSRIYTATDFGTYYLYFSVLNVLLMFSSYRYEVALLSVQEGNKLHLLMRLILLLCFINALICTFVIIIFGNVLAEKLSFPGPLLYVFPAAIFIGGAYQALGFFPVRYGHYYLVGAHKISHSSGFLFAGLAFFYSCASHAGLILGDIIGRLLAIVHILKSNVKYFEIVRYNWKPLALKKYINVAFENKDSLILIFPGTLLSSGMALFLPIYLVNQFSLETLGQFSLVERFLVAPCTILAVAMSQAVTGDFSDQVRAKSYGLQRQYRKFLIFLLLLSSVVALFCWFFAPLVILVIFGQNWAIASVLAKYSTIYVATIIFLSPINMLLLISGMRKQQLLWEVARFTLMAGYFIILSKLYNVSLEIALLLLGGVLAASTIIFAVMVDKAMGILDKKHGAV